MSEKSCRIEITGEAILALLKVEETVSVKQIYFDQEKSVVGLVLEGDSFPKVEEGQLIPLAVVHYIPGIYHKPAKSIIRIL